VRIGVSLIALLAAMAVVLVLLRIPHTKRKIETYITKRGIGAAIGLVMLVG
jgi:hypothetical protein